LTCKRFSAELIRKKDYLLLLANDRAKTNFISVRLRRTVREEALDSVLIKTEVIDAIPDKDGGFHVNS
jgi:hypothetical protein